MNKIFKLIVPILLLTGCVRDETYNKAKCNDKEYDIKSITRFSDSNYKLTLKDNSIIEVHPVNCIFYNGNLENKGEKTNE